jgi:hypothetical protein
MPRKDRTSPEALEKQRKYSRDYYYRNQKDQITRNTKKKNDIRDYIKQYKESRGCMDCGNKFPYYVLDLDHREGTDKKFTPAHLHRTNSWEKMIEELKKCDVVCANCHRIRTHTRGYANKKE